MREGVVVGYCVVRHGFPPIAVACQGLFCVRLVLRRPRGFRCYFSGSSDTDPLAAAGPPGWSLSNPLRESCRLWKSGWEVSKALETSHQARDGA